MNFLFFSRCLFLKINAKDNPTTAPERWACQEILLGWSNL